MNNSLAVLLFIEPRGARSAAHRRTELVTVAAAASLGDGIPHSSAGIPHSSITSRVRGLAPPAARLEFSKFRASRLPVTGERLSDATPCRFDLRREIAGPSAIERVPARRRQTARQEPPMGRTKKQIRPFRYRTGNQT